MLWEVPLGLWSWRTKQAIYSSWWGLSMAFQCPALKDVFHSVVAYPWDLLGVFILPEEYKGTVNSQQSLLSCGCTSCSLPRGCAFLPSSQEKWAALSLKGICCGICHDHVSGQVLDVQSPGPREMLAGKERLGCNLACLPCNPKAWGSQEETGLWLLWEPFHMITVRDVDLCILFHFVQLYYSTLRKKTFFRCCFQGGWQRP